MDHSIYKDIKVSEDIFPSCLEAFIVDKKQIELKGILKPHPDTGYRQNKPPKNWSAKTLQRIISARIISWKREIIQVPLI